LLRQVVLAEHARRLGRQDTGAGAAVDAGVPRAAGHPDAAGELGRGARQLAGAGAGAHEGARPAVSGREDARGRHPGDPQPGEAVRGRVGAPRLCGQRRLGDVPGL